MTSHYYLDNLPEVVQDSRLEAVFGLDGQRAYTVHPEHTDPWAASNQERWYHGKRLGSGGGGKVDLEVKESRATSGRAQLRAVKRVEISSNEQIAKLHRRELVAVFKFSQPKYSNLFVKSYGWYTSESHIYIAMEYLELGDLQGYLSDQAKCPMKRLPETEVHDISTQILRALHSMHSVGFSHRDLKPANVLIKSQPPAPWKVKLADFGISKRGGEITESTGTRGTRNFMPPELLGETGDKPEVLHSFAIDMWCFGQTIHRALTGQNPFSSVLAIAKYWDGNAEFPTTTLASVDASANSISFIRALMMADPQKRLTTIQGLSDPWILTDSLSPSGDYSRAPSSESIPQASSLGVPTEDEYTSNEATASWTDVLATRTSNRDPEIRTLPHVTELEVTASWTEALGRPNTTFSTTIKRETTTSEGEGSNNSPYGIPYMILNQIIMDKSRSCSQSEAVNYLEARRQLDDVEIRLKNPGLEHPDTVSSMRSLGFSLSRLGLESSAASVLRETWELEKRVLGEEKPQTVDTMEALAHGLRILKRYEESEELYRKIIVIEHKNGGWRNKSAARNTQKGLGLVLYDQGKYEEAIAIFDQLAFRFRTERRQDRILLEVLENLVRCYTMSWNLEQANVICREYISRHKNLYKSVDVQLLAISYLFGSNLAELKKPHEAELAFREAQRIVRALLPSGGSHDLSPSIGVGLAKVLYSQKKYGQAEIALKDAIQLLPRPTGPDDLDSLGVKTWLYLTLEKQAKYADAARVSQEICFETAHWLGPNAPQTLTRKLNLGRVLMKANRFPEAEKQFREVTEERTRSLGAQDTKTIESASRLAYCRSFIYRS